MKTVVDEYHGTRIPDPYRWLERVEDPGVREWIEAQSAQTRDRLDHLPGRAALEQRLTELWDYPKQSVPVRRGGRSFYFRNSGLQNQPVLYVQDADGAEPRVLFDPNTCSSEGTVALSAWDFSEDGSLLAYALSTHGSDWQEVRVRDVATAEDRPDRLRWIRFTALAFSPDNQGLYYSRYPAPGTVPEEAENYYQRLCYHRLGQPQEDDLLIYERPDDKDMGATADVTRDGRLLVISVWKGTDKNSELYVQRLDRPDSPILPIATGFDAGYSFLGSEGDTLFLRTDLGAPRRRIVAVDVGAPERSRWREIVPESEDVLVSGLLAGGSLIVLALHRARHRLLHYELDGRFVGSIQLPTLGSVVPAYISFPAWAGRPEDPELFFSFASFLSPQVSYRYDVPARRLSVQDAPALNFDPGPYQARQVFYESRDGTLVSMFLVHRRGLRLDGQNPTYLYGYGGFNIDLGPEFKPGYPLWLELGGVIAIPNLRGGGEYGEEWHRAGMLEKKQNVFDDFIAAAEWLIDSGITSPARLGIAGRSNGGLLTAACLIQRPELFGAVVSGVPVVDMLRYHLFTIGHYWTTEYGCAEDPKHFPFLSAYSPLHNVQDGVEYPATLITTADTDDRVFPAHAFKFAARLQEAQGGPQPISLRVELHAGHGAGTPTDKAIRESADVWAFLCHHLGVEIS